MSCRKWAHVLSIQTLSEMRSWLKDCAASEDDCDYIERAGDAAIVRLVARHFSGGIVAFLTSN